MPNAWREVANTTFKVFSMTIRGIKPQSPGYQTDALTDTPSANHLNSNPRHSLIFTHPILIFATTVTSYPPLAFSISPKYPNLFTVSSFLQKLPIGITKFSSELALEV